MLVSSKEGIKSTAHTFDLGRELGRDRGDVYESMVWEDSITVIGNRAYMYMAVAQEAIVLPENVSYQQLHLASNCITSNCILPAIVPYQHKWPMNVVCGLDAH